MICAPLNTGQLIEILQSFLVSIIALISMPLSKSLNAVSHPKSLLVYITTLFFTSRPKR